ncbi:CsbD family protein [uncultured Roseobacter sp.]|uniref:CsbD family protein n=1 Tax=uncultured Roseobacter sp. TaxID=114847 RepID=UPI0026186333|nr:CsbD family protein [uncultured Roseobacter sp.]
MNWDIIKGNWSQMTGDIKAKWGELTEDEISEVSGEREKFVGLIQEKYGYAKSDAEHQVDAFFRDVKNAA